MANNIFPSIAGVWHDFSQDSEKIAALLSRYAKQINYIFNKLPNEFIKPTSKGDSIQTKHIADNLVNKPTSNGPNIVISDRALDKKIHYDNKFRCIIISIFSSDPDEFDERAISKLIYAASIVLIANPSVDTSQLHNILLRDALAIDVKSELLPNVDKKNYIETLGCISYSPFPTPIHALITHGIHTTADWAEIVGAELKSKNIGSSIYRYEWVDIFRFVFCKSLRRKYSIELLKRLNITKARHPTKKSCVIVHSFGSILLHDALLLAENTGTRLEIDKIILNGSIIPHGFDWDTYTQPNKKYGVTINNILNICGDKDACPIFAKHFKRGMGYSGTFFFSDNHTHSVINIRLPNTNHRSILSRENAKNIWANYLLNNNSVIDDIPAIKSSFYVRFINFIIIFTKIMLPAFLFAVCMYQIYLV